MPQSLCCLHVHFVFSTKKRVPHISAELQSRLFEYIGGVVRAEKCCLIAAGGMPDHVHLLLSLGREITIADTMRLIKANSARWIHATFPEHADFAWQNGYGAFGVSFSQTKSLQEYIAHQEEHHRRQSFQDEFRALLERHHIAFDERYVWD